MNEQQEAEDLSYRLRSYWSRKGYIITAAAIFIPAHGEVHSHWSVRSDLVNGRPPRKTGFAGNTRPPRMTPASGISDRERQRGKGQAS